MSELDKVKKVHDESQAIGEFLDWLFTKYFICKIEDNRPDVFIPVNKSQEQWLAEYFGIDLIKLEKERRELLDSFVNRK